MVGDGDQADRARMRAVADALDDACLRQTEAAARERLAEHNLAVLCALRVRERDPELGLHPAVGRLEPAAVVNLPVDAEHTVGRGGERAHDPGLVAAIVLRLEFHERPLADAQRCRHGLLHHPDLRRRGLLFPGDGLCQRLAVEVEASHLDNPDARQAARGLEAALAGSLHRALALDLADQRLERKAVPGFDLEGAHQIAPGERRRALGDVVENLRAAR